jgi:hypothetical protein
MHHTAKKPLDLFRSLTADGSECTCVLIGQLEKSDMGSLTKQVQLMAFDM